MSTAGVVVEFDADSDRWLELVREAAGGQELRTVSAGSRADHSDGSGPDVQVTVASGRSFEPGSGHRPLTRGAWSDGREVILLDACASGLDLVVRPTGRGLDVVARPNPGWRHRALGLAVPDRRLLLHRAALVQYPALWWSGVLGRVPLHVSAVVVDGLALVLAGPGGVGKSTLVATLDGPDDAPVSDNLCVTDGRTVHGLLEPARAVGGHGRRMPHGRRESTWPRLADSVVPDAVAVLRRGDQAKPVIRLLDATTAARELVGGTYAAGELRRYWAFAATLALGTGLGPAHPPVAALAESMARSLPAFEVLLPSTPGVRLRELVTRLRASAESTSSAEPPSSARPPSSAESPTGTESRTGADSPTGGAWHR
ncbi:hypothetical protein [Intrasporangium mesophilum]